MSEEFASREPEDPSLNCWLGLVPVLGSFRVFTAMFLLRSFCLFFLRSTNLFSKVWVVGSTIKRFSTTVFCYASWTEWYSSRICKIVFRFSSSGLVANSALAISRGIYFCLFIKKSISETLWAFPFFKVAALQKSSNIWTDFKSPLLTTMCSALFWFSPWNLTSAPYLSRFYRMTVWDICAASKSGVIPVTVC